MAFSGIVGASNIGSFLLQAMSFGQCTMNKYNKIKTPLLDASQNLMKSMDEIRQYSEYLNNDEFENTMDKCETIMKSVMDSLYQDAARESFLVKVKEYRQNKKSAQKNLILSIDVQAEVQRISTRAKRRTEQEQKKVDVGINNQRLKRIDDVGSKLAQATSIAAAPTHGSRQAVVSPPSPSPSQSGNEPRSPFKDPSASVLNQAIGGEAGDIYLQRVMSK